MSEKQRSEAASYYAALADSVRASNPYLAQFYKSQHRYVASGYDVDFYTYCYYCAFPDVIYQRPRPDRCVWRCMHCGRAKRVAKAGFDSKEKAVGLDERYRALLGLLRRK